MTKINRFSYVAMALLIVGALTLQLVPAVFAGFLVYTLTQKLSQGLLNIVHDRFDFHARAVALAVVIFTVVALCGGAVLATATFVKGSDGLPWLIAKMADILDRVRLEVPLFLQAYVPGSVNELNTTVVEMLRTHSASLSAIGVESLKSTALLILAIVAGAMVSWNQFALPHEYKPFAGSLLQRLSTLTESFEKVVFAQVKISAINAFLTAIYLLAVLPACGIHLPLAKTLVGITFVAGLLPVVGNLVSNTIIVVISLGISPQVCLASLGFLVAVHKLEYFLNAKIIGHNIDAAAWELIITMIVMERLFGVPGLVTAPVIYAYLKRELKEAGLVGRIMADATAPAQSQPEPTPVGVSPVILRTVPARPHDVLSDDLPSCSTSEQAHEDITPVAPSLVEQPAESTQSADIDTEEVPDEALFEPAPAPIVVSASGDAYATETVETSVASALPAAESVETPTAPQADKPVSAAATPGQPSGKPQNPWARKAKGRS